MKKKKSIWTYFIKMFFVFMIIFSISQLGTLILQNSFTSLKYGPEIISQSIWAVLVVIVVFVFKNSYIFKEEREKITTSLKLGWPLLLIATILLILNIVLGIIEGSKFSIPVILNLATYCLLIGIVEEFLCRGWLLNEFLERFSDSNKNKIISIILSSIIFGFIHIFNLSLGQSLADTLIQILNASFLGIAFALIYYKTKNIWSVVIIHAFWDFGVLIGDSANFVDCVTTGNITSSIMLYNLICIIIISITGLLICYWIFKQTTLSNDTKKLSKKMYYILPFVVTVLYVGINLITPKDYEEYYICPTYEQKNIGTEFEIQYYSHAKYDLEYTEQLNIPGNTNGIYNAINKYNFSLLYNENYQIEFQNNNTKEKVVLLENSMYDYILIENEASYVILIQTDYNKVLYGLFQKEDISNDNKYLESVKEQLSEYIVPSITSIGSVTIGESDYKYAQIQTETYDKLYFDKTGTLYIVTQ